MNESEHFDAFPDRSSSGSEKCAPDRNSFSRRSFLQSALAAAGMLLIQEQRAFPNSAVLRTMPPAVTVDLVHDTINGLSAFVVPGPDAYSVAQGNSTSEPGAIAALTTEIFIPILDGSVPFVSNFSGVVAGILNQLALAVNPGTGWPVQLAVCKPFVQRESCCLPNNGRHRFAQAFGRCPARIRCLHLLFRSGCFGPGDTYDYRPAHWVDAFKLRRRKGRLR